MNEATIHGTIAKIVLPNAEDSNGEFWDPWLALAQPCAGYSARVDQDAIAVLRGIANHKFCTEIAAQSGLSESHVELLQSIFCGADWCEYGTSPRGCWPIDRDGFPQLIAAWEAYYRRHWQQEPDQ